MKKIIVFFILLIFVIGFFVTFYKISPNEEFYDTHTSAVCIGNVCQDYLFTCMNGKIVNSTVLSGLVVFGQDWIDLREENSRC